MFDQHLHPGMAGPVRLPVLGTANRRDSLARYLLPLPLHDFGRFDCAPFDTQVWDALHAALEALGGDEGATKAGGAALHFARRTLTLLQMAVFKSSEAHAGAVPRTYNRMLLVCLFAGMGLALFGVAFVGLVTGWALDLGRFGSEWVSLLAEPARFYFAVGISVVLGLALAAASVLALLAHLRIRAAEESFTTQAQRESRLPSR